MACDDCKSANCKCGDVTEERIKAPIKFELVTSQHLKCNSCPFISNRIDVMENHWLFNHRPPRIPKKGAGRRLAKRLKELGEKDVPNEIKQKLST